jgi:hypothetical protein
MAIGFNTTPSTSSCNRRPKRFYPVHSVTPLPILKTAAALSGEEKAPLP